MADNKTLLLIMLLLAIIMQSSVAQPRASGSVPVIVAPVQKQAFADRIEALGTTKANETVIITTTVTETIREVFFDDGQQVKQGAILLTLDKFEEEADLKSAHALRDERLASYNRAKTLEKQQAVSVANLDEREALLRQSEGEIDAIQSRINDRMVRAPFDGVLSLRQVSPGALVQPGDKITTLDDLSRIKVDFDVPSVFLNELHTGLPIEGQVAAFGNEVFSGTVSTVSTQIDPVTRTVTVRAILPNPDHRLRPGLLMSITLSKNLRDTLLVPESALIQRAEQFFVLAVVERDGKSFADQKQVNIGERIPGKVEITSGLEKGERVVVHGLMQTRPGQEVVVKAVANSDQPLQDLLKQSRSAEEG
jgi:membrane fusion protein (multidrug efflux system)